MPGARHLIVENAGHEDMLPQPASRRAIVDFSEAGTSASRGSLSLRGGSHPWTPPATSSGRSSGGLGRQASDTGSAR